MRVSQGGHDVPTQKLTARFPRSIANLKQAIRELPQVLIFDNSELDTPFRKVGEFQGGKKVSIAEPMPRWLAAAL